MKKQILISLILLCLACLNLASVRKNEDPILNTQAEGVLYRQKMEEEKDGVKGPLLYHVRNNPSDTFFIDPPFAKDTSSEYSYEKSDSAVGREDVNSWWDDSSDDNALEGEKGGSYTSERTVEEAANDSSNDDGWW